MFVLLRPLSTYFEKHLVIVFDWTILKSNIIVPLYPACFLGDPDSEEVSPFEKFLHMIKGALINVIFSNFWSNFYSRCFPQISAISFFHPKVCCLTSKIFSQLRKVEYFFKYWWFDDVFGQDSDILPVNSANIQCVAYASELKERNKGYNLLP